MQDIYYNPSYASLFLEDSDELFDYSYKEGQNWLTSLSIKKPIHQVAGIEITEELYDLETTYGYGGFRTNCTNPSFLSRAWINYQQTCQESHIVAEFVRSHPFHDQPSELTNDWALYTHDRNTVYVDLSLDHETIRSSYKRSLRGSLTKAAKSQLTFHDVTGDSQAEETFKKTYDLTMQKNNASEFYYFDDNHFQKLFQLDEARLCAAKLDDQLINMCVIFVTDAYIHYHLGAGIPEQYKLCGNPYLLDQIIQHYAGSGKKFHLGGGRTSEEEDPLFKFKSNFSDSRCPFHIGGIIHNKTQYNRLNAIRAQNAEPATQPFFLKYRLP